MFRVLAAALALVFGLAACGAARAAPRGCPPPAEAGEALFRRLFEAGLSRRDSAAAMEALAPTVVFHARGRAAALPREQLWSLARPILSAFPDVRFTVEEVVASGERAAARVSFAGTHRGEWGGIAPTGRRVSVSEMFMCRLEAGRLAECWQEWDEHGLRQQLAAPP